jgi:hypothetical protein
MCASSLCPLFRGWQQAHASLNIKRGVGSVVRVHHEANEPFLGMGGHKGKTDESAVAGGGPQATRAQGHRAATDRTIF